MKVRHVYMIFLIHVELVIYNYCSKPSQYNLLLQSINIGGMLSNKEFEAYFNETVDNLNFDSPYISAGITYRHVVLEMEPNPIRTAINVCKHLIARQVLAIIVSHSSAGELSPAAVSYTCGFYHIPVIGISSRDSAFSDKNIHVSFLRTVPPYSHQADVWVELLKYFNYMKIIFIHTSDAEGRSLLGRFQSTSQIIENEMDIKIQVEYIIELNPGMSSYKYSLQELNKAQSRVYLLHASEQDADVIFKNAAEMNMTGTGAVWIVTEQALNSKNIPTGALGLRLINATDEKSHIKDSLYVLVTALREMNLTDKLIDSPKNCDNSGLIWETGRKLFEFIKQQKIDYGQTGRIAFDDNGDRIYAEYDILNVKSPRKIESVGQYVYSPDVKKMKLLMSDSNIVWPGDLKHKPEGFLIPTHLKVLTIEEKPFVYARKKKSGECREDEILCPYYKYSSSMKDENEKNCCRGYCIDLLRELSKTINFTYSLYLSSDGEFGSYSFQNTSSTKKEWTGLIAEIVYEKADMIVAPLTINPERAEFIEFSKPFKYQGITILEKKPSRSSTLVSFLQPFSNTLWILVMVSVHVVALVLYLLDRFSPFGRFRMTNSDNTEEDALNLSSAIWFAWGVLLNSGIGEGTPRSFSARVLGMVWAGFAMIIVASYTANLAAFLVLERPKTKLSGINDARLRNTMENLTCATVKGSAVDMYFRRQVELSNMYRTMEANNYKTAEEAINDVKIG
uniref:Glutamate [NMDA] receptor subunit 1 n=1 Tax=Trichogramma kaykai TaxID=54128 RepID=A0ABD2WUB3_9HYME